jgi:hypothetical protein
MSQLPRRLPSVPRMQRESALWLGRHASKRSVERGRTALGIVELGAWVREKGFSPQRLYSDFDLFEFLAAKINRPDALYLEFGVFEGRSMRWWCERLTDPTTRFVGFDSFDGLPEHWTGGLTVGSFATSGPPSISDPRVSFEVGLFEETLKSYAPPDHDQLIVNIDCDIYSATVTVLTTIRDWLRPGSLLYFDEFAHSDHEQLAFREFLATSGVEVVPLAYAGAAMNWAFQVTAIP